MEFNIIKFLQSGANGFYNVVFSAVSVFASFTGFLIVFFIFFFKNRRYAYFFGCSYVIIMFLNTILKFIINRPRPYEVDKSIISIVQALGKSFPSGHTASTTVVIVFVLFYAFKKFNRTNRILISVLALVWLALVALSRMYLGQHYLSDILGAILISGALCIIALYTYVNYNNKVEKTHLK